MCFFTGTLILLVLHGISISTSLSLLDSEFSVAGNSLLPSPLRILESQVFEQKVDHFNSSNDNTWLQRYYEDKSYYETGGPVYLLLEHGDYIRGEKMNRGYWHSHGKDNKAMFFYLSHRYYEFYMPVNQALEDSAAFIKATNKEHSFPKGTKWIVFGSSFAANLAAWLRTKYPDLVHEAVASSAVPLAKMDCPEFLNSVGDLLAKHKKKCREDIVQANKDMEKLVQTPEGRNDVERMFKLCDPLDGDSISISYFMTTATRYLSDAVLNDFKRQKVDQICKKLLQHAGEKTPIQRYYLVLNMLMGVRKDSCILSNFLKYSESLNSTITFLALHYGRIELYQHCNEFGWFRTSNEKSIFSKNIDLTYFLKLCSQTFGFS